jgi:uncharacterized protein (DUF2336 family)
VTLPRKAGPDEARARDLRHIARYGAEAERAELAALPDTPPELLFFLGADRSAVVRARVASNRATPPQADRVLARDEDPKVRELLARRIAALAPGLGPGTADRLRRMAWETLCLLAEDAVASVRAAISEVLAEMTDAPRDLVLRLARDSAPPVAEPVIRLSPLLTDADLLALIVTPPAPFTRRAVASRVGLSATLADRLARIADDAAIAALLENGTADIAEATLAHIASRARDRLDWQAALVRRPVLSSAIATLLAAIVADEWAAVLAQRADLDPHTAAELRARLALRAVQDAARPGAPPTDREPCDEQAERAFLAAAAQYDIDRCVALLAQRSGLSPALVARVARLRSAKALTSIAWRAGFSPAVALPVQTAVGGLPPEIALRPASPGDWPLSAEEMRRQLELLAGGD